jgi:3-deoxy-7-phosphoheptulonate synthase
MIIVMSHGATKSEVDAVVDRVHEIGLKTELSKGEERTIVGVIGGNAYAYKEAFSHLGGIQEIIQVTKPFKLASREFRPVNTVVDVGGVKIGGDEVVMMAGPCSVEGEEMLLETARHVAKQGARILRGGAFKPRTSPYSFQGLGEPGL